MPGQIEFVNARQRYLSFMAGRGYGKTHAIAARIVSLCAQYPGFRYRYMTPLYKQGEDVFNAICNNDSYLPYIHQIKKRPYPQIFFKGNGKLKSECVFRSMQRTEGLRGDIADEICLDESQGAEITDDVVNGVLMPILSRRISLHGGGNQRGTIVLSGQFRGEDFRYEKYWRRGLPYELMTGSDGIPMFDKGLHLFDVTRPNKHYNRSYKSWAFPSHEGWSYKVQSGGLTELEGIRENTLRSIFEREYLCLPRANSNAVFDSTQLSAVIGNRIKRQETSRRNTGGYVCGIDPGCRPDPTKLVVVHSSGDIVFAEEYPKGQPHAISARMATQSAARYNAACVVDCTGGAQGGHGVKNEVVDAYREEAQKRGLPFYGFFWTEVNKNRIIENLEFGIQQQKISIPPESAGLITELREYEYTYSPKTKRYFYGAPANRHDDYVAALATAWDGILTGKAGRVNTSGMTGAAF